MSYSQVPSYLNVSDVLLMVYPNTEHYAHFMSPLKLFEYMASGVHIVTSDLPSVREVLDNNSASFFVPDDVASLEKALLNVYENPDSSKEKALEALQEVSKYTWDKRAGGIVQFINAKK